MRCGIVTIFPEMFQALEYGITGRALQNKLLTLEYFNPRDFTLNKHRSVDDRPYGGGPGMVMNVEPLVAAINAAKAKVGDKAKVIYLSPQGKATRQRDIESLADLGQAVFVAGRYEGIDERVCDLSIDEEWSLGDYVLSGGELAAMTIIDAATRLIPGALGDENSKEQDSFSESGLLDWPHYTRPEEINGLQVPKVLLSGDHAAIHTWRLKQQLGRTWLRRPELLDENKLSSFEKDLLASFIKESEEEKCCE